MDLNAAYQRLNHWQLDLQSLANITSIKDLTIISFLTI